MYVQNLFSKLPTKFISNREFCYLIDPADRPEHFSPETADEWIHHRSGIRTRAYFSPDTPGCGSLPPEIEVGHVVEALKPKIDSKSWNEIDAVVSIRSSPHHFIPNLSQRILCELNTNFNSSIPNERFEKEGRMRIPRAEASAEAALRAGSPKRATEPKLCCEHDASKAEQDVH